jgi:hypothetical protein
MPVDDFPIPRTPVLAGEFTFDQGIPARTCQQIHRQPESTMQFLANLFVARPLNIFLVALVFLAGYLAMRFSAFGVSRHPRALLIAAAAWAVYAAWEWLVQARTPEANIRVDLMLIWPLVALLSAWALYRALR